MMHYLSLFILFLNFYFSINNSESIFSFISESMNDDRDPKYSDLKEWLGKLIIDLPNDLIKEETKGYLENLTIYGISLEKIITTSPKVVDNKIGVTISLQNLEIIVKGVYILVATPEKFIAYISKLNAELPFYLVRDTKTGLVSEVDTSGFTIDLDHMEIDLELEIGDLMRNVVKSLLKSILSLIKTTVIEKRLIETMNTKLGELFKMGNDIIQNGIEPKTLNIAMKEQERTDLKKSTIISAATFLLNNLTGTNGPLSFNNLVDIITADTGVIQLHEFYNKSINFEFNVTDSNNNSLGNIEVGLIDLNISGLNTWKNFTALEPFNKILLRSFTGLEDLTINISFSFK